MCSHYGEACGFPPPPIRWWPHRSSPEEARTGTAQQHPEASRSRPSCDGVPDRDGPDRTTRTRTGSMTPRDGPSGGGETNNRSTVTCTPSQTSAHEPEHPEQPRPPCRRSPRHPADAAGASEATSPLRERYRPRPQCSTGAGNQDAGGHVARSPSVAPSYERGSSTREYAATTDKQRLAAASACAHDKRPAPAPKLVTGRFRSSQEVPPAGFEPAHTAPEAVALSPELRGRGRLGGDR